MKTKIFPLIALLIILTGSIFLRLYKLGDKPAWNDETISISHAEKPLDFYLASPRVNYKPVYFFLLNRWLYLGKEDVFYLRLFSLIWGVLNIFLIYKLARLLFNEETGLLSAFLLGFSVFHIFQCQQIRQFSFIALLSTASIYYLARFYKTGRILDLELLLITNILLINTHPTGFFVIMAEAIFAVVCLRGSFLRKWVIFCVPLALFAVLWLFVSDKQHIKEMCLWITKPGLGSIIETFNTLSWGGPRYGLDDFRITLSVPWLMWMLSFVYFILVLFGLGSDKGTSKRQDKRARFLLSLWLVVPILASYSYSFVNDFSVYAAKHLIVVLPAFCIIVAKGMLHFRPRVKIVIIFFVCLLNLIPLSVMSNNYFPSDWKNSTEYVAGSIKEGDAVIICSLSEVLTFMFYFDKKKHTLEDMDIYGKITPDSYENSVFLAGKNNLIIGIKYIPFGDRTVRSETDFQKKISHSSAINKKRVWTMLSRWTDPLTRIEINGFMNKNFRKTGCRDFQGVEVCCFEPLGL